MIPIGADLRLSWEDGMEFRGIVNRESDAMLALGGQGSSPEVVESLERSDGRAITFQFHPEAMDNPDGKLLLDQMVAHARSVSTVQRRTSCDSALVP